MIRKSEADALGPVPVDDGLPGYVAFARTFYCSKGYDMLNIDISLNGEVVARYFADPVTKEFKAFLIGESWSRITLQNIVQKAAGFSSTARTYYDTWNTRRVDWHWIEGSSSVAHN
ncbi:MAG: hypothetical protein ACSW8H_07560, partial [bacterium]